MNGNFKLTKVSQTVIPLTNTELESLILNYSVVSLNRLFLCSGYPVLDGLSWGQYGNLAHPQRGWNKRFHLKLNV